MVTYLVATGAVECIACVKTINEHLVPPTINLDNQDERVGNLDYVPHKARKLMFMLRYPIRLDLATECFCCYKEVL